MRGSSGVGMLPCGRDGNRVAADPATINDGPDQTMPNPNPPTRVADKGCASSFKSVGALTSRKSGLRHISQVIEELMEQWGRPKDD